MAAWPGSVIRLPLEGGRANRIIEHQTIFELFDLGSYETVSSRSRGSGPPSAGARGWFPALPGQWHGPFSGCGIDWAPLSDATVRWAARPRTTSTGRALRKEAAGLLISDS